MNMKEHPRDILYVTVQTESRKEKTKGDPLIIQAAWTGRHLER